MTDPILGYIHISPNPRARRVIFHILSNGIKVTTPVGMPETETFRLLEKNRESLISKQEEMKKRSRDRNPLWTKEVIDLDFRLKTSMGYVSLKSGTRKDFHIQHAENETCIICPPDTDFSDEHIQEFLRKAIEQILRKQARQLFPARLKTLSELHGLSFKQLRINNSKGRWGSCSSKKHINLSCYLLLLPPHLIDFVMLHELSHTVEMNHGPAFHALLDKLTNHQESELNRELKEMSAWV